MDQMTAKHHPPFMEGILPIKKQQISTDMLAGITLAALAIPEVMGYTKIAGMPVVTGLYTIFIPLAIFALFGSSRHMVVGADSATAAIMSAGLVGLATVASPEYVAFAVILALLTAVLLILARLIRLGFIADFLSRTVLIGFLTGVGILVAIGQISGLLGIPGGGSSVVEVLITVIKQLNLTNFYTLAISLIVLTIIIVSRKINKKIPGALIAVILSIVVSYSLNLSSYGVSIIGPVPGGLPKFGIPSSSALSIDNLTKLLPIAFSMFIVIIAQSAATARAYAYRYDENCNENLDLVGLGLANIGAGISGTFVINGSPTKTQMVDSAGGRSQLASLTTSFIVLIVLLFLTRPLTYMPEAVLSSVVFLIGLELIDIKGMRMIFFERPVEFSVALITAMVVVFIGIEQGILLAIALSILIHTRHGYKPRNALLGIDTAGRRHNFPVTDCTQLIPGLMIYRFHHSLYFANSQLFSQEVLELVNGAKPPLTWFSIDMDAVDDVDFSAAATLRETYRKLNEKRIRLVLSNVDDNVRTELVKSGIIDLIGAEGIFETNNDVEIAFKNRTDTIHTFQNT